MLQESRKTCTTLLFWFYCSCADVCNKIKEDFILLQFSLLNAEQPSTCPYTCFTQSDRYSTGKQLCVVVVAESK